MLRIVVRIMFRFGILSSVVPLVLAGGVAHDWTQASDRQCFVAGLAQVRSAPVMAFTDDPSAATVKVQLVEAAELADLAIADDASAPESGGCDLQRAAQRVEISVDPVPGAPVVHLTRDADADYRIYVDSAAISAQQAAALIVSARGGQLRLAASDDTLHTASVR